MNEQVVDRPAGSRIEVVPDSLKTATESVMIKPAGKQIIAVPAVCETVTEQVLVAGKSSEWKRGKAWLSQTTMVRPVKGFLNDKGEVTAAAGAGGNAKLSAETAESLKAKGGAKTTALVAANVTRQVVDTAASSQRRIRQCHVK